MGGSAIKTVPMRRLGRVDFERVGEQVTRALREAFPGLRVAIIPAYRSKADFGDLDVILESGPALGADAEESLTAFAQAVGHAREVAPNGNVYSFDYRASKDDVEGFQVDIILTPSADFDTSLAYFAFNDLGNLMGRTAHKMGFSWGHRGLLYPVRDGNHQFAVVEMSKNLDVVLPFLGYDVARYRQGFDNLEEIFGYVAGSTYFNRDIFLLENRNHTSRTRDRKRKTYRAFLEWLDAHPDLPAYGYPEDRDERHALFLDLARQTFPSFGPDLDRAWQDLATSRFVRTHFNGDNIRAWTGLSDKDLSGFIGRLRATEPSTQAWAEFLQREGKDGLEARVRRQRADELSQSPSRPRP